jgi:hypothetical protein
MSHEKLSSELDSMLEVEYDNIFMRVSVGQKVV